jgi:aspartyl-tRNA(Asn)/glutamyl-tRNA(Gln) amidotransferase subunit C
MPDFNIAQLAALSRLQPGADDLAALESEVANILDFVAALKNAPTAGVAPLTSPLSDAAPLRPDAVELVTTTSAALANAPLRSGDYFVVPKVIE